MATMKKTMKLSKTMEIVMDAMFIALVFAATWLINIRLPLVGSGGLIHLGNHWRYAVWKKNGCNFRCVWHGTV